MLDLDRNPSFHYHAKCKRMKLTHLSFADDLTVFCRADHTSLVILKRKIEEFARTSGLIVNSTKSQIFLSSEAQDLKQFILDQLQYTYTTLPVKYLGMPLISSRLSATDCLPVIDKIRAKLSSWSVKFLSYAGRLQLINSIIFHLQTYWSSMVIIPNSIFKKIEELCRNFLWSGQHDKRAIPLVAWEQICLPRCEGGLGIKQLKLWNKAALAKHLWKICKYKDALWPKWIHLNYIKGGSIWEMEIPQDSSWSLRKILQTRELFKNFIAVEVGDGRETLLFYDQWMRNCRLADIEVLKDHISSWGRFLKVRDWWESGWKIPSSFHRRFGSIADQIEQHRLCDDADRVKWLLSPSGNFTIASAYEQIRRRKQKVQWHRLVWHGNSTPR